MALYSIIMSLDNINSSKKTARRVAKERNSHLRDFYLYNLSALRSITLDMLKTLRLETWVHRILRDYSWVIYPKMPPWVDGYPVYFWVPDGYLGRPGIK